MSDFDIWDSVYSSSNSVNESTEPAEFKEGSGGKEWPKKWTGNCRIDEIVYAQGENRDGQPQPTCEFALTVCDDQDMSRRKMWKKFYLDRESGLAHMFKEIGKLGQKGLPTNQVEAEKMVRELTGCEVEVYRACRLPDYKQPNIYFNRMVEQPVEQGYGDIPF